MSECVTATRSKRRVAVTPRVRSSAGQSNRLLTGVAQVRILPDSSEGEVAERPKAPVPNTGGPPMRRTRGFESRPLLCSYAQSWLRVDIIVPIQVPQRQCRAEPLMA